MKTMTKNKHVLCVQPSVAIALSVALLSITQNIQAESFILELDTNSATYTKQLEQLNNGIAKTNLIKENLKKEFGIDINRTYAKLRFLNIL